MPRREKLLTIVDSVNDAEDVCAKFGSKTFYEALGKWSFEGETAWVTSASEKDPSREARFKAMEKFVVGAPTTIRVLQSLHSADKATKTCTQHVSLVV